MFCVGGGEFEKAIGDLIMWEVGEIVVIFVDFDDLVQTAAFKGQGLVQHLIDSGATNNRKMAKIVVISLK